MKNIYSYQVWHIAIFFTLNSLIHGHLQNKWSDIAQIQHEVTSVHPRLEMTGLFVKIKVNIFKEVEKQLKRRKQSGFHVFIYNVSIPKHLCASSSPRIFEINCSECNTFNRMEQEEI